MLTSFIPKISNMDLLADNLVDATETGNLEKTIQLINQKAPIDHQNRWGNTALMLAAENGHLEVIRELIKAGASLDLRNIYGETALMRAKNDHLEVIRELIKAGASLDLRDKIWGWTALMRAVAYGNLEIVRALLQYGATIDLKNNRENSAYELARDDNIKRLIDEHRIIRKNIETLKDLRINKDTYFSQIPRDLIDLIGNQLEMEEI